MKLVGKIYYLKFGTPLFSPPSVWNMNYENHLASDKYKLLLSIFFIEYVQNKFKNFADKNKQNYHNF